MRSGWEAFWGLIADSDQGALAGNLHTTECDQARLGPFDDGSGVDVIELGVRLQRDPLFAELGVLGLAAFGHASPSFGFDSGKRSPQ